MSESTATSGRDGDYRLPVGSTVALAARSWWRNRWRVGALGATVVAPLVVLSNVLVDAPVTHAAAVVAVTMAAGALTVVGEALCSGLAEHMVRHDLTGRADISLWTHLRSVPLWRLTGVSLLTGAVVLIGLLLCVLPGVVAFAWLALATPVTSFERVGVWQSLRRSVALVRGQFWRVASLTTAALALFFLGDQLEETLADLHAPLWTELIAQIGIEAVVVTATAAVVVAIHRQLRDGYRAV